ncbi:hypothetical protein [Streptomyces galbus]|nr:hypothetical protein [Streptomyces galbus]GHD45503.1 hypothetical protein GCM10010335_51340 [Streptomyces galbus]
MSPSEDGGGSEGSSWASAVFDMGRDALAAQADVAAEYSSFTAFRKRVDDLIRDLKGSAAGPDEVGRQQLARHEFGGGDGAWAEASGLFTAYETVITELESLSKLLSDSMEGMSIAVLASHKGYENIDLDVRDRMAAISAEATRQYGGGYEPRVSPPGVTGRPGGTESGGTPAGGDADVSGGDAGGTI